MTHAPILLFTYNRPEHTRKVLEALRGNPEAAESELVVFSDGPRTPEAMPAVQAVRDLCRGVAGFAQVTLVERPLNLGLAKSILTGVSEVIKTSDRVIVLEDDILVSSHFLAYMNGALARYEHEERVMQVSGHLFDVPWSAPDDAAFLPMTNCLGWGTWKRVWEKFDPSNSREFQIIKKDIFLQQLFDLEFSYPYFHMLKRQYEGKANSWAVLFYLHVFMNNGLVLYPRKSLVHNIGFDGSGTNGIPLGTNTEIDPRFTVQAFPVCRGTDRLVFSEIIKYHKSKNRSIKFIFYSNYNNLKFHLFKFFLKIIKKIINYHSIVFQNAQLHPGSCVTNMQRDKRVIRIGEFTHVRGELLVFPHGGTINMGEYCYLGENSKIWSSCSIEIGDRVLISHGVTILDNLTHPIDPGERHRQFKEIISTGHPLRIDLRERPVRIEDDAWIACNCTVLPGVTIGRGAIVGAGSVVTKDVPPGMIVAGNPAVILRKVAPRPMD